jgi:hypothetical protein
MWIHGELLEKCNGWVLHLGPVIVREAKVGGVHVYRSLVGGSVVVVREVRVVAQEMCCLPPS